MTRVELLKVIFGVIGRKPDGPGAVKAEFYKHNPAGERDRVLNASLADALATMRVGDLLDICEAIEDAAKQQYVK